MQVREATVSDVPVIHSLISYYAELDRMLFRSLADIYEDLQNFLVAEMDGRTVGCCALQIIWSDLAEIQSLAVNNEMIGRGIGKTLVRAAIEKARRLGIKKVFALTLEPQFFEKVGFVRVDKKTLPMKVWTDCSRCPKQAQCDETALIFLVF